VIIMKKIIEEILINKDVRDTESVKVASSVALSETTAPWE